jgi:hypothetical protein
MEENMEYQNGESKNVTGSKWLLQLAFIAITLIGFFSLAFVTGNYLDALSIPVIIGFIWLGAYKQKFALAISLVAVVILIMIPVMVAGLMHFSTLITMLIPILITALSLGAYRFPLPKMIAIFIFAAISLWLLYVFDYLDNGNFIVLMVGGGGALLGGFLFANNKQESPHK